MRTTFLRGSIVATAALLLGTPALASERADVELCDNLIDDDGDGHVDEEPCQACDHCVPTSDDGVVPELWYGNPTCDHVGFGDLYGFKIDATPQDGTYWFTSAYGVLDGGPEDPDNYVVISNTQYVGDNLALFDWASTLPVSAVIVKSHDDSIYVYDPPDFADGGLGTPDLAHQISHVEFCYSYALTITKTADTSFSREYTWTIDKLATPDALEGFVGETVGTAYEITVDRSFEDFGFTVSGEIDLYNPASVDVGFVVTDEVEGGYAAVVTCPAEVIGAGESMTCTYVAVVPDAATRLNTVTVVTDDPEVPGDTATAIAVFGTEPDTIVGYPEVSVTDTNGGAWQAGDDATFEYTTSFLCPTDPALYVGGSLWFQHDNTATITETGQQAPEAVEVTCYAPVVSKDAHGAYKRTYTWDIDKQAAPSTHVGFPGDDFASEYLVSVERIETDSDFVVSGTIVVGNPHPTASMTVTVADVVGEVPATLDCGGTLVVPAGGNASCGYNAALPALTTGTNTATVGFGGASFVGTADWTFGEPAIVGYPEVTVTDTNLVGEFWSASGSTSWTYSLPFECPIEHAMYMPTGVYETTFPNTATIDQTGQSDDALVALTCYDPADARVIKTTDEGPEDIGQLPFVYELRAPGGTVVETATLNGAGELTFGSGLEIEGIWTISETVPAGWVGIEPTSCTFEVDYRADAGMTYTCAFHNVEKGRVALVKYENGYPAESEWTFALYLGPQGYGTEPVETVTIPYAGFTADLDPFEAYTLCELSLPAGWSAEWMIDTDRDGYADTVVTPYNPDVGEDLGNRCFEFGAGTDWAVPIGDVLVFEVDNQYTGEGGPRTPGYWKNWSTCTPGNQAETAARNGGPEEGFWLIDDVLPVTWDDILADAVVFPIDTCEEAWGILSMRDLYTGKVHAGDPAYKLARNLLAYQANATAGACSPGEPVWDGARWQTIESVAVEAETLLDKYDFGGTGTFFRATEKLPKKPDPKTLDAIRAQQLAATLDLYNNGLFCGGPE